VRVASASPELGEVFRDEVRKFFDLGSLARR
jgi:hypothetical protein